MERVSRKFVVLLDVADAPLFPNDEIFIVSEGL